MYVHKDKFSTYKNTFNQDGVGLSLGCSGDECFQMPYNTSEFAFNTQRFDQTDDKMFPYPGSFINPETGSRNLQQANYNMLSYIYYDQDGNMVEPQLGHPGYLQYTSAYGPQPPAGDMKLNSQGRFIAEGEGLCGAYKTLPCNNNYFSATCSSSPSSQ